MTYFKPSQTEMKYVGCFVEMLISAERFSWCPLSTTACMVVFRTLGFVVVERPQYWEVIHEMSKLKEQVDVSCRGDWRFAAGIAVIWASKQKYLVSRKELREELEKEKQREERTMEE